MSSKDRIQAHITVSGLVQGVFFRASAQDAARRLGVAGWVRNVPDGRVELVCEGQRDRVEQFVQWCRQGPDTARVKNVQVDYADASGEFDGFYVR